MRLTVLAALVPALLLPSMAAAPTLNGTVGPGSTIQLTKGRASVHTLKAGHYVVKVADKSDQHNLHLKGPGVSKHTSVPGTGSATWKVTLRKGKYVFLCDAHPTMMMGRFTVT